jgi:hypothetical protein
LIDLIKAIYATKLTGTLFPRHQKFSESGRTVKMLVEAITPPFVKGREGDCFAALLAKTFFGFLGQPLLRKWARSIGTTSSRPKTSGLAVTGINAGRTFTKPSKV